MATRYVTLVWRLYLLIFSVYTTYQFNTNGEATTQYTYHEHEGTVTTITDDNTMSTSASNSVTTVTARVGDIMATSAGKEEDMATTSHDNDVSKAIRSSVNDYMDTTTEYNDMSMEKGSTVSGTMAMASEGTSVNMDTSSPVNANMVATIRGIDNSMETSSTTTSQGNSNSMETRSTVNHNTTSSGNVGKKDTDHVGGGKMTSSWNMVSTTTSVVSTDEVENDVGEAVSTTADKSPFYVFGSKVTITGDDQLTMDDTSLTITCSPTASYITEVTHVQLYRTMYNTVYLESILSIDKQKNESVLDWMNEALGNRPGVSASGQTGSIHNAHLTFSIAPNYTRCEDAVEYKCFMAVRTATGDVMAVSSSKHVALYPSVEPTYTDSILVSPTSPVNSDGSYTITEGTVVQFTCTGTVGSDKIPHEWQIKTNRNYIGSCVEVLNGMVDQNDDYLVREGCNFRRTSVLTYPTVLQPVEKPLLKVWCRPYVAQTSIGECDELSDNGLVREISIAVVPNPNDTSRSTQPGKDIPYIIRNDNNVFREQQTIQLRCTYVGVEPDWYIWYGHIWIQLHGPQGVYVTINQIEERHVTTLVITQCSLADRGWYLCSNSGPAGNLAANQTIYVDILYDKCRDNGIVIPGGGCIAIVSSDTCLSSNGSMATIHTQQKSQLMYNFAYESHKEVSIGLTLTSNKMRWKDFVWTDGSSLTYAEEIGDTVCIGCKEESEFPITIGMSLALSYVKWQKAHPLSDIFCEWKRKENITGITIPPSNATYSGTKPLFQCAMSEEFISIVFVCDRIHDCADDSDEYACAAECSGTHFRCEYGGCISASNVCDFFIDCPDGSDEQNCNHQPCTEGYWKCDNAQCIPVYDVCDGEDECADASDEYDSLCTGNANEQEPTEYTFWCFEPNRMLPSSRICDGFRDCFSTSDEEQCQPTYQSCRAWSVATRGINSTTAVDYGMAQYGPVTVRCEVDKKIHTQWPFSAHQQFQDRYVLGDGYVTHALWFELRYFYNSKYRTILYSGPIQQKAMMSASTICVQYLRPCGYFVPSSNFTVEWSTANGKIYNMHFLSTDGCFGYCNRDS